MRSSGRVDRAKHPTATSANVDSETQAKLRSLGYVAPSNAQTSASARDPREMAPLAAYLPFNRDCIKGGFEPAKRGAVPGVPEGRWLILQEQSLVVSNDQHELALPAGARPTGFDAATTEPICLGTCDGVAHWALGVSH